MISKLIPNFNSSFYLMSPTHDVVWPKSIAGDKTIVVRKLAFLHNLLQESIKEVNEILSIEVLELKKTVEFLTNNKNISRWFRFSY